MENKLDKDVVQENIRVNALLNSNVCELIEECKILNKNIQNSIAQTQKQLLTTVEKGVADFNGELTRSIVQMSRDTQEKISKEHQYLCEVLDKTFSGMKEELKRFSLKGDKEAEATRKFLEERTQKVLSELGKGAAAALNEIQAVENQVRAEAKRADENVFSILTALGKMHTEIISSVGTNTELVREDLKVQAERVESSIKYGFEQVWSLYGKNEEILSGIKEVQEKSADRIMKNLLFSGGAVILGIINLLLIIVVLGKK